MCHMNFVELPQRTNDEQYAVFEEPVMVCYAKV